MCGLSYMDLSNAVIELVFVIELVLGVVSLRVPSYFIGIGKFLKILVKVIGNDKIGYVGLMKIIVSYHQPVKVAGFG